MSAEQREDCSSRLAAFRQRAAEAFRGHAGQAAGERSHLKQAPAGVDAGKEAGRLPGRAGGRAGGQMAACWLGPSSSYSIPCCSSQPAVAQSLPQQPHSLTPTQLTGSSVKVMFTSSPALQASCSAHPAA